MKNSLSKKIDAGTETVLDMDTIRQRVKNIKRGWSQETAKQRAEEGKRRRAELEQLLSGQSLAMLRTKCDFTLVV